MGLISFDGINSVNGDVCVIAQVLEDSDGHLLVDLVVFHKQDLRSGLRCCVVPALDGRFRGFLAVAEDAGKDLSDFTLLDRFGDMSCKTQVQHPFSIFRFSYGGKPNRLFMVFNRCLCT